MKNVLTPIEVRFWPKVSKSTSCWVWKGSKNNKGYGKISNGGRGKGMKLAHRLSYEIAYGPISKDIYVLHICDNPSCVRPDHLFLGSKKDNSQDMAKKGRHPSTLHPEEKLGTKNGRAKLNDAQVEEIILRRGTCFQRELAEEYGVSQNLISKIQLKQNWKHVGNKKC